MILTLGKKTILWAVAVVLLGVVCCVGVFQPNVLDVISGNVARKIPVYNVDRNDNKVALTFDAAWGGDKTQGILDILEKYDVKATFFLVGFWIDKYPELVKKIDEAGCEIGNHSRNHPKLSGAGDKKLDSEIDYVNDQINKLIGKTPKFFRAPFGDYDNGLMKRLEDKNMIGIQWDVDSLDWKGLSGGDIAKRISKAKSGSIILCHNNSDHILDALPLVIASLKNKGYQLVTMSELVYTENYFVDNNGVQHLK